MKRMPASKFAIAMILILSVIATACSTDPSKGTSKESNAAPNLTIALAGEPEGLDPQNSSDNISNMITYQIADNLVTFNQDMQIVPQLAESWTVSDDEKSWTFKLKQGVSFQDGAPFNADAVKTSFERVINENNKLTRYSLLGPFIDHISVNGDTEVTFHLKNPLGPFLNNLAAPGSAILSPKSIKENPAGVDKNPVGTGPFKLKEWSPGNYLLLEANPDYWGGKPNVGTLTFKPVPDNSARVLMLETGEADVILPVPTSDIDRLAKNDQLAISSRQTNRVLYIGLNNVKAPLNNVKVRQALNYGIDKETLVNKLLQGRVKVATSAIGEKVFGYSNVGAYPYDLKKAKQLLQEAGVTEGTTLRFVYSSNVPQDRQAAEFVQNSLQQLGFKVELRQLELGTYTDTIKDPNSFEMYLRGAAPLTNDADYVLRALLLSGSKNNYNGFSNPEIDKLLEAGFTVTQQEERERIYADLLKGIKEEAPWIFLYEDMAHIGMRKNVEGIGLLATQTMDFRKVIKK